MPGEKKNAGGETEDAADEVASPSTISKQTILSKEIADIIIR